MGRFQDVAGVDRKLADGRSLALPASISWRRVASLRSVPLRKRAKRKSQASRIGTPFLVFRDERRSSGETNRSNPTRSALSPSRLARGRAAQDAPTGGNPRPGALEDAASAMARIFRGGSDRRLPMSHSGAAHDGGRMRKEVNEVVGFAPGEPPFAIAAPNGGRAESALDRAGGAVRICGARSLRAWRAMSRLNAGGWSMSRRWSASRLTTPRRAPA